MASSAGWCCSFTCNAGRFYRCPRGRWRIAYRSGAAGGGHESAQAPAANKLQACGGSSASHFIRRKVVNLADQKLNILMTFISSTSGALLVQSVQSDILRQILPVLVICIGLYFLLMLSKLGEEDRQRRLHGLPFALSQAAASGFTDGFFGPCAGSFYALAFVITLGRI